MAFNDQESYVIGEIERPSELPDLLRRIAGETESWLFQHATKDLR